MPLEVVLQIQWVNFDKGRLMVNHSPRYGGNELGNTPLFTISLLNSLAIQCVAAMQGQKLSPVSQPRLSRIANQSIG